MENIKLFTVRIDTINNEIYMFEVTEEELAYLYEAIKIKYGFWCFTDYEHYFERLINLNNVVNITIMDSQED